MLQDHETKKRLLDVVGNQLSDGRSFVYPSLDLQWDKLFVVLGWRKHRLQVVWISS